MLEKKSLKRKSWKKELAATARQRLPPKKKQNSEDPSGSIRDITAHLIHEKYLDSRTLYSF